MITVRDQRPIRWKNLAGKGGIPCAHHYPVTAVLVESYVMGVRAEYEDVISSTTDRQCELLKNE